MITSKGGWEGFTPIRKEDFYDLFPEESIVDDKSEAETKIILEWKSEPLFDMAYKHSNGSLAEHPERAYCKIKIVHIPTRKVIRSLDIQCGKPPEQITRRSGSGSWDGPDERFVLRKPGGKFPVEKVRDYLSRLSIE